MLFCDLDFSIFNYDKDDEMIRKLENVFKKDYVECDESSGEIRDKIFDLLVLIEMIE